MTILSIQKPSTWTAEAARVVAASYIGAVRDGDITEDTAVFLLRQSGINTHDTQDELLNLIGEACGCLDLRDRLRSNPDALHDIFDLVPPMTAERMAEIADAEALNYQAGYDEALTKIVGSR